jgi:hypothetical protein
VFADRRFAMGSVVAFIYGMALFGSTYLLPVYMQMGLQLSPSYVGGILLPSGLALALTIAIGRPPGRPPFDPPWSAWAGPAGRCRSR